MRWTTLWVCASLRHPLAALIAMAAVAFTPGAASAEGGSRALAEALQVVPGATCVTAAALGEHVRAWLGSDQVEAGLSVQVIGSDQDPRSVSFTMGRGGQVLARRRFEPGPDRCEDLQAALGLSIALAIRVSLLDEFAPPAPRATPVRAGVWSLAGDALASWGVLPGSAVGVGFRAGRELPPNFELRLGFDGQGGWDKTFAHVSGSFDAALFAVTLDACVTFSLGGPMVRGRGCLGFQAGGVYAQGKDFGAPRSSVARWLAAANAVGVTIDVAPRWSLEGTLTLVLPVEHPRIGVQTPSGTVVDARDLATVGGELAFGPAYRF